jgi:hypothetical protein
MKSEDSVKIPDSIEPSNGVMRQRRFAPVVSGEHSKDIGIAMRVRELAGVGLSRNQVALAIGVSVGILGKYYLEEFNAGASEVRRLLACKAVEEALGGNTPVLLHMMKTKLGWVENQVVEHIGEVRAVVSSKPLTAEEFSQRFLQRDIE